MYFLLIPIGSFIILLILSFVFKMTPAFKVLLGALLLITCIIFGLTLYMSTSSQEETVTSTGKSGAMVHHNIEDDYLDVSESAKEFTDGELQYYDNVDENVRRELFDYIDTPCNRIANQLGTLPPTYVSETWYDEQGLHCFLGTTFGSQVYEVLLTKDKVMATFYGSWWHRGFIGVAYNMSVNENTNIEDLEDQMIQSGLIYKLYIINKVENNNIGIRAYDDSDPESHTFTVKEKTTQQFKILQKEMSNE